MVAALTDRRGMWESTLGNCCMEGSSTGRGGGGWGLGGQRPAPLSSCLRPALATLASPAQPARVQAPSQPAFHGDGTKHHSLGGEGGALTTDIYSLTLWGLKASEGWGLLRLLSRACSCCLTSCPHVVSPPCSRALRAPRVTKLRLVVRTPVQLDEGPPQWPRFT